MSPPLFLARFAPAPFNVRTMAKARSEPESLAALRRRRDSLVEELGRVYAALAALEAEARRCRDAFAPPRRGNPARGQTLADALAGVLRENPMRIKDAAEAVRRAGYESDSADFRQRVANALADDRRFRRIRRGTYVTRES